VAAASANPGQRQRQRKHAGDGGQRSHEDGPQAALRGMKHGGAGVGAFGAITFIGIKQQDAILAPRYRSP